MFFIKICCKFFNSRVSASFFLVLLSISLSVGENDLIKFLNCFFGKVEGDGLPV